MKNEVNVLFNLSYPVIRAPGINQLHLSENCSQPIEIMVPITGLEPVTP